MGSHLLEHCIFGLLREEGRWPDREDEDRCCRVRDRVCSLRLPTELPDGDNRLAVLLEWPLLGPGLTLMTRGPSGDIDPDALGEEDLRPVSGDDGSGEA